MFPVVLRRPAEQAEEIDKGFRQKSGVAIGGDADHGTVAALGKFGTVGRDQQRQMRKLRRRKTRSFEDEHVLESVRQMVLAADDVGDAQVRVIRAGSEMVRRHAVGTKQRKVFDISRRLDLLAINRIGKSHPLPALARHSKTQGERLSCSGASVAFRL